MIRFPAGPGLGQSASAPRAPSTLCYAPLVRLAGLLSLVSVALLGCSAKPATTEPATAESAKISATTPETETHTETHTETATEVGPATDIDADSASASTPRQRVYIECGCGCCVGVTPSDAPNCVTDVELDAIMTVDKKARQNKNCRTRGCSPGVRHVVCS